MTMPVQLLVFIVWLLFCLLGSNMNTEARITADEGNQVGQFQLLSLNTQHVTPKPPPRHSDHEHNRAITSHQARDTSLLLDSKLPPSPSSWNSGEYQGLTTWCIAKPSADYELLLANIDFCCKQPGIDCSKIQPGGQCYSSININGKASFVMNLYYKANSKQPHTCYFNQSGLIVSRDPSFGSCIYP